MVRSLWFSFGFGVEDPRVLPSTEPDMLVLIEQQMMEKRTAASNSTTNKKVLPQPRTLAIGRESILLPILRHADRH